jgi:hypothetical protein
MIVEALVPSAFDFGSAVDTTAATPNANHPRH